jgi:hypothetical protein
MCKVKTAVFTAVLYDYILFHRNSQPFLAGFKEILQLGDQIHNESGVMEHFRTVK